MLNHSSSTLTHVSINGLAKNADNIQPDTVLRLCPNLISFIFEAWVPPLLDDESLWKSKKLTNFKLRSLSDLSLRFLNISAFYDFDPEPFLEATPNLRYFSTNIAHLRLIGPRFGNMISKHCPKLVSLTLYESVRHAEKLQWYLQLGTTSSLLLCQQQHRCHYHSSMIINNYSYSTLLSISIIIPALHKMYLYR